MTRKSRRELEHALDGLEADSDPNNQLNTKRCETCSETYFPAAAGVTAEFVVTECACDRDLPDGAVLYDPRKESNETSRSY